MPSFSSYSTFSTRVCTSQAPPPKQGSSGRRDSFASSRPASRTSFSNQRYRLFQKLWSVSISKNTLRIDGISTISYDWRSKTSTPKNQIDLVIERADKIVNLCEIKYSQTPYFIDKNEYQKLLNWREAFSKETGLRHTPWITLIASEGLAQGMYSDIAQGFVTKDDLFDSN